MKDIFLNLNFYFMRVNCARHIKKQCAKVIFLNLNFYFNLSTKKINVLAARCIEKSVNAPEFATCTHVRTHQKIDDKNGPFNWVGATRKTSLIGTCSFFELQVADTELS